jgi:hypothetical protein
MNLILYTILIQLFFTTQEPSFNLSTSEIEMILGKNSIIVDNSEYTFSNRKEYKYTYHQQESASENKAVFSYMYEHYTEKLDAENEINKFMKSNSGFGSLTNGDEIGFIKTDNKNFCLVVLVKNNHMIRLKLNRLENTNQIKQVETIAKNLIKRI